MVQKLALILNNKGYNIIPEIMIPLTCSVKEFEFVKSIVEKTAKQVLEEKKFNLNYKIGTMILINILIKNINSISR